MRLRFDYQVIPALPKLAWLAQAVPNEGIVKVICGAGVERHRDFFATGAWDGAFTDASFDTSETFYGTGAKLTDEGVLFVTPSHSLERLLSHKNDKGIFFSNSLPLIMEKNGLELDRKVNQYEKILCSMLDGPQKMQRDIPLANGETLQQYIVSTMQVKPDGTMTVKTRKRLRPFTSFEDYYSRITATLKAVAENAKSPDRANSRFGIVSTISSGYDSPACAAIAKQAGCTRVLSLSGGIYDSDDGSKAAREMGYTDIIKRDKELYRQKTDCIDAEFISSGELATELQFSVFEDLFADNLVVLGARGSFWDKAFSMTEDYEMKGYYYFETSVSFTENALKNNYLIVPLPAYGASVCYSVRDISNSEEMKPWSMVGTYDKPIPRRIAEAAGAKRESFGQKKIGGGFSLGYDSRKRMSKKMTFEGYQSFSEFEKKRLGAANSFNKRHNRRVFHLKVNNVNDWEPQGIEAAEGFAAAFTTEAFDKGIINLFITSTGTVNAAGEQVIASVPVRTWYPHNALGKNSNWIITQKKCVYPMDTQVFTKAGKVVFTDDTVSTFSAPVIQCDSEAMCEYGYIGVNKGNEGGTNVVTSWHEHNAQPMADKDATCTESGYTGRTYCADCESVIDWGTVVPATGHSYAFVDGVLKCEHCGDLYNGEYTDGKTYADGVAVQGWVGDSYYVDGVKVTGIVPIDGVYYEFDENGTSLGKYTGLVQDDQGVYHYAKFGEFAGGWFDINDEWFYFDTETLAPVAEKTFTYPNSKAVTTYQFEQNGKIVDGVWVELAQGTRYYYGPDFYHLVSQQGNVKWQDIDGYTYGFDRMGFRHEGMTFIRLSNNPQYLAEFTDEGVYLGPYTGIYEDSYYVDGYIKGVGLIVVDGDYYYITQRGKVYMNDSLYLNDTMTNGLMPAGVYEFDEAGKMILKNGVIDGMYYENGAIVKGKGLVKVGNDYYFVKQNGAVYTDSSLYIAEAKTNGLFGAGMYYFNTDGTMILNNGIVDGYYYENNELVKGKGLIYVDGNYYYIGLKGQVYTGTSFFITEEKANTLLPAGKYYFNTDGTMIINNGIVDGYYYENNVLVKGKGVVQSGDDFYFVTQKGSVYTGASLFIGEAKTNGLIPAGMYYFAADGKIIIEE